MILTVIRKLINGWVFPRADFIGVIVAIRHTLPFLCLGDTIYAACRIDRAEVDSTEREVGGVV